MSTQHLSQSLMNCCSKTLISATNEGEEEVLQRLEDDSIFRRLHLIPFEFTFLKVLTRSLPLSANHSHLSVFSKPPTGNVRMVIHLRRGPPTRPPASVQPRCSERCLNEEAGLFIPLKDIAAIFQALMENARRRGNSQRTEEKKKQYVQLLIDVAFKNVIDFPLRGASPPVVTRILLSCSQLNY